MIFDVKIQFYQDALLESRIFLLDRKALPEGLTKVKHDLGFRGEVMLVGNPDSFAIWCDSVESWSNATFKNGCFGFFIGGRLIWSLRSTLGVDFSLLVSSPCHKRSKAP